MRWLISPSDLYFEPMKRTAKIYKDVLPDADVVVFFEISKKNWLDFLETCHRQTDRDENLRKT
jgi:hypothetical protein